MRINKTAYLLFALLLSGCQRTVTNAELVVGLEAGYAPFNWTTTVQNEHTLPLSGLRKQYVDGYDVEIARYLGEQTDKKVTIKKIEWDSLIPALDMNSINVIIAGMSFTEERDQSADFSLPYYQSELVGVVLKTGLYVDATTFDDIAGATLISQLNTVQDAAINAIPGIIHAPGTDSFGTAALSVAAGSADILIAEYPVAVQIVNANTTLSIIHFEDTFEGVDERELAVNVVVKEGNNELREEINAALGQLSQESRDEMMVAAIARASILD